jgi:hypothetical protein
VAEARRLDIHAGKPVKRRNSLCPVLVERAEHDSAHIGDGVTTLGADDKMSAPDPGAPVSISVTESSSRQT